MTEYVIDGSFKIPLVEAVKVKVHDYECIKSDLYQYICKESVALPKFTSIYECNNRRCPHHIYNEIFGFVSASQFCKFTERMEKAEPEDTIFIPCPWEFRSKK